MRECRLLKELPIFEQLPVMLAESQLQAFSAARRLVMLSDVWRT